MRRSPHLDGWTPKELVLPVSSLSPSCRIYVNPQISNRQLPAIPVKLRHIGTENWSYAFSTRQPGVLVWTQAYDPLWRLSGTGMRSAPLPVLSLLNGYPVDSGRHSGTIAFAGEPNAIAGLIVTVLVSLVMLALVLLSPRIGR